MPAPAKTAAQPGFCRDCLTSAPPEGSRCPACGSPRLIRHAELFRLAIAHLDCDAFYAAIEKRDNPELADKPVIVGGGKRGVVATACYIARIRGVRSAMPMFQALKACPDAVVVRPNFEKYGRVGREVRSLMQEMTPLVEPLSIDEAFMDLAGTERLHHAPPALALARLQRRVETEIGITVSIGLSFNKFLAKIASDLEKPRGFSVIGEAEATSFLAPKPVGLIWGVGKTMQARLAADGIHTIGSLQRMDEAELGRRYGSMGLRLARLSRGDDRRSVDPRGEAKSVSAETTFDTDLADPHELKAILRALSEKVSRRLKKGGTGGRRGDPQAEDFRFSPAHPQSAPRRSDTTGRPDLPGRRRTACARDRRAHQVPADRHRRVGIHRSTAGRPGGPDRSQRPPSAPRRRPPSTRSATSSATAPSSSA